MAKRVSRIKVRPIVHNLLFMIPFGLMGTLFGSGYQDRDWFLMTISVIAFGCLVTAWWMAIPGSRWAPSPAARKRKAAHAHNNTKPIPCGKCGEPTNKLIFDRDFYTLARSYRLHDRVIVPGEWFAEIRHDGCGWAAPVILSELEYCEHGDEIVSVKVDRLDLEGERKSGPDVSG